MQAIGEQGVKEMPYKVSQEGKTNLGMPDVHDWNFDTVMIKYININCIMSVLFTKLKSGASQSWTKLTLGWMGISCHSTFSNPYFQRQQYNHYAQQKVTH